MFDKLPVYPNEYFSFEDGKQISNDKINKNIKRMIDEMLSNGDLTYTTWSCGDTKIFVEKGELEGDYIIEVYKNYHTEYISFRD